MMLLHGEQYLAIKRWPLPTESTVVNKPKLLEVLDKGAWKPLLVDNNVLFHGETGKAAAVTTAVETCEKKTGEVIVHVYRLC